MPPPNQQSSTANRTNITYKLVSQLYQGAAPTDCSNGKDHILIETDPTSYLNSYLPPNAKKPICRVHFSWDDYSGDMSGAYDDVEDTLISTKLLPNTLRNNGAGGTITDIKVRLFKERTQDGTVVDKGGRYVRMDVTFAGPPALSAKIWGKRVMDGDNLAAVQLSKEEKMRLGIEDKGWRWKAD